MHVGNLPPVANDDGALAQVGGPNVAIDVLANDRDADGDLLTIAALGTATLGTATIEDGEVIYRPPDPSALPDPDRPGRIEDTFSYSIEDGQGGEDTALVRVDLNRAPEAGNDLAEAPGLAVAIDVLADDRDLDGDALEITGVGETALGAEVSVDGGQIVYTRLVDEGEAFVDVFAYVIGDGRGGSASASVVVFGGQPQPFAPTLIVEPSETELQWRRASCSRRKRRFPKPQGLHRTI